ncbi:MAG: alternative ribosome rescue aminoacyl-tRNA hydrolase ArfB [Acetobacterales bacterium]
MQEIRAGGIVVPEADLEERFVRASGPGGQNVNKLATAVELRFDAAGSAVLPEDVRARLLRLAGRRATADGVILIRAERFRTQERNRVDARERLAALLERALTPPKPRKKTRPTKGSKERRLDSKKRRASVKQGRGKPLPD